MNRNLLLSVIALFFVASPLISQDASISYKDFSQTEGVDREAVKTMKKAEKLYALGGESYQKALPIYLELHDQPISYSTLNWRIALCYLHSDKKANALDYLLECDSVVSNLHDFYLGKAYQFNGDFEQAKEYYQLFADSADKHAIKAIYTKFTTKTKDYSSDLFFETLIQSCDIAIASKVDSLDYTFRPLDLLNSSYDELFPTMLSEDVLLYTSRKASEDNAHFQILEGSIDSMQRVMDMGSSSLFPKADEDDNRVPLSSAFLGQDTLLFQSMLEGGDIVYSYKKKGKTKAEEFKRINSSAKESTACLLSDSALVVSSNREEEKAPADLFISFLGKKDKWSKPVLLSGNVNTKGNEEVLCFSDRYLYYISNGKGTMGGYDIFKVAYLGGNNWGMPINMGYPINTADNDMGLHPIDSVNWIYAGVRSQGLGGSDLYWLTASIVQPDSLLYSDSMMSDSLMYADSVLYNDSLFMGNDSLSQELFVDSAIQALEEWVEVTDTLALLRELSDSIQVSE